MNDHIPATIHTEMTAAEKKIALDESCKRLLSEKSILAWILHACVAEFKDVPVRDIAEKYIEGTPELGEVRVLPEETNLSADATYTPKIQGSAYGRCVRHGAYDLLRHPLLCRGSQRRTVDQTHHQPRSVK